MEIQINIKGLTPPQKRLFESKKRFTTSCFGRQSGKTTTGILRTIVRPLQGRPGGIYWYILQTHSAAEVAFNRYWDRVRGTKILKEKPNESEKFCRLVNDAIVFFKSGENYEDLRVETLDGVVIDEYRQQHPDLWSKVVRPMLARHQGWADILSTPNGFEHFYDLCERAKVDPEWDFFQAPSTEAPWWTEEEIKSARSEMSEDEFAQEILAEFREMGVGKTYKNHSSILHGSLINPFTGSDSWSPYLPIIVGLDFNVGLMCWELGQHKGGDWYWRDEIAIKNTDSDECARVLVEKIRGHKPGVVLIGDASGKARKTSAVGKTDYSIITQALSDAGIKYQNLTPEDNPAVKDRINAVNSRLKSADGSTHAWYHPINCKYLKRDLEKVKWKEGADGAILDKSDPLSTHASDAAGYPMTYYSEMLKTNPGILQVIQR